MHQIELDEIDEEDFAPPPPSNSGREIFQVGNINSFAGDILGLNCECAVQQLAEQFVLIESKKKITDRVFFKLFHCIIFKCQIT